MGVFRTTAAQLSSRLRVRPMLTALKSNRRQPPIRFRTSLCGAGAVSTWSLALPGKLKTFDYTTISDVILHVRHTARDAGGALATQATNELVTAFDKAGDSAQSLLFCLRYDFPTEWSAFVNGAGAFEVMLKKSYFPYAVQGAKHLTIDSVTTYAGGPGGTQVASSQQTVDLAAMSAALTELATAPLSLPADPQIMIQTPSQQVYLVLNYHFGVS
jgi:Tc toxin complex TcA C-terminal TcB-binding domain